MSCFFKEYKECKEHKPGYNLIYSYALLITVQIIFYVYGYTLFHSLISSITKLNIITQLSVYRFSDFTETPLL